MKLYVPTPEQLGTLFDAGFTVSGTQILAIKEMRPKLHKNCAPQALVCAVANAWDDGMLIIRGAPDNGYYVRKIKHCATQEEAFNRAMAYVLLGLYDEGAEGI